MTNTTGPVAPPRGFLEWDVVTDPAGWDAAVALLGLPHSEAYPRDVSPNDQALAPDAIRATSWYFSDGPDHWDFDLGGARQDVVPARCIDIGNMPFAGGDYGAHAAAVTAVVADLLRRGTRIVVLGGDHGVTIPVLDALPVLGVPIHVVHIDAHLDWREEVDGVPRGYSSPLRWASNVPCVAGMTQIGLRGTGSARAGEVAAARAWGSNLFTARQIHADGIEQVLATIPADRAVYITIDADGLDPTVMPGVMGPSPGGLTFDQVARLLHALGARHRVVGMDLVEVAPSYDFANRLTCITAGRLVINLLGAIAGQITPSGAG